jgi:hypothetical protein
MKHPSAWYVGDTAATMDDGRSITVKIRGFRTYPELVQCEYPDGSIRSRPFSALTPARTYSVVPRSELPLTAEHAPDQAA